MEIMFYEAFEEEARLLKKMLPPSMGARFTDKTIQATQDRELPAQLISIRTQSIIPLGWSVALKGILSRSDGFDHLLDYQHKTRTQARLGHLSGYCSRAVAEQAVMLMLALMRRLPRQMAQMKTFQRDGLTGVEAQGKRALVVGVGRIGGQIVAMARGLGMEVRGVDIVKRQRGLRYLSLAQGALWADVILIALPLTPRTEGLVDERILSRTKRKPFLINVGRGEVLSIEGLIRLLGKGRLGGVALDVFPYEGRLGDRLRSGCDDLSVEKRLRQLMALENVICTPHNAFNTAEALVQKCRQTIAAIEMFLSGGRFPYEVKT